VKAYLDLSQKRGVSGSCALELPAGPDEREIARHGGGDCAMESLSLLTSEKRLEESPFRKTSYSD